MDFDTYDVVVERTSDEELYVARVYRITHGGDMTEVLHYASGASATGALQSLLWSWPTTLPRTLDKTDD